MSAPVHNIPPRRSLLFFAMLAIVMVLFSYLFILLLAAACVYLPWLAIRTVKNFQTLALFVGGVVSAGIMLRSLIPRRDKFEALGILLERVSHPRLFAEIESIAKSLQEPLPREIYLIGEPNAWVADRGGLLGFGSRRVMGLGLPLLALLNVSQFRAILTHEFAHYYGGDTRLGAWVHRTQMAMIRTFRAIAASGEHELPWGVAVLYMVVSGMLKWYWLLFLRAVNFVSRRQEFRADELACILAGPEWLMGGLVVVHGAAIAWPTYWQDEVVSMINLGCLPPVAAGFSYFLTVPDVAQQVQSGIETEIRGGKRNAYDTHPPLRDRLTAAERLAIQSPSSDLSPALGLLNDLDSEELRFLEDANPTLPKNWLKRVSWEERNKVLISAWEDTVTQHRSLLCDITAADLFEVLARFPQIALKIHDPKGMLLRPERVDLLAAALGLILVNNGWTLHSRPGECYLSRGDEQLDPPQVIRQLSGGAISKEAWAAKCREMGIADISLGSAARSGS